MNNSLIIGVDLMGSDHPPVFLLEAVQACISHLPCHVELVPIGVPSMLPDQTDVRIYPADTYISMEELPLVALRKKKYSSLSVGMQLLKQGRIDAFLSTGNTGALVSCAKINLGTFPGLKRPALAALIPTQQQPTVVLDIGANVDVLPGHLVQFAELGTLYQKARGIKIPSVGLLNIGSESTKGTQLIQKAYKLLEKNQHSSFLFKGNIEGRSVFDGDVDVLITDGFTGNIFLKTAEGIASILLDQLKTHFAPSTLQPILAHTKELSRHLHYAEYPGALLLGVNGIVIKCHGSSSQESLVSGIRGAIEFVSSNFLKKMNRLLEKYPIQSMQNRTD